MASKKYDLAALQADREDWIDIPTEILPKQYQKVYEQRKMAVDMYIDGYKMSDIEERTTIRHSNLPKLLERCLCKDQNNIQYGYLGLIPQKKINMKLSANEQLQSPFMQLLADYSELEAFIKGNYFGMAPYTMERVMNVRTLHEKFLYKCKELQISDNEYPFNTDTQGYYALYRYVKKIENENLELAAKRMGKDAQQKLLSTGIGKKYSQNAIAPFNMIQVDGHIIDMIYTTKVKMPDGTVQAKPAHRCWIFAVIDVATRCIIGYSTSQYMNYDQYDILRALQNSILPHKKIVIVEMLYQFTNDEIEYKSYQIEKGKAISCEDELGKRLLYLLLLTGNENIEECFRNIVETKSITEQFGLNYYLSSSDICIYNLEVDNLCISAQYYILDEYIRINWKNFQNNMYCLGKIHKPLHNKDLILHPQHLIYEECNNEVHIYRYN